MNTRRRLLTVVSLAVLVFVMRPLSAEDRYSSVASVIRDHCLDCHTGEHAEAGLDLHSLRVDMAGPARFRHWMRVHDRVAAGEMPPADAGAIDEEARTQFVEQLAAGLRIADLQRQAAGGRTGASRSSRSSSKSAPAPLERRSLAGASGLYYP
ncbi:MAG TPA: c-type cytochrome domain-containing protein [Pirellulaceae bacterium]|nr:c-type cytochrome domain-containing protein [Pirellulaceae bacterium]